MPHVDFSHVDLSLQYLSFLDFRVCHHFQAKSELVVHIMANVMVNERIVPGDEK